MTCRNPMYIRRKGVGIAFNCVILWWHLFYTNWVVSGLFSEIKLWWSHKFDAQICLPRHKSTMFINGKTIMGLYYICDQSHIILNVIDGHHKPNQWENETRLTVWVSIKFHCLYPYYSTRANYWVLNRGRKTGETKNGVDKQYYCKFRYKSRTGAVLFDMLIAKHWSTIL